MSKTQIGWYNLKEDKIFMNTFECAAWHEDVLVKAGRYPAVVYDMEIIPADCNVERLRNMVSARGGVGSAYAEMEGTIAGDYFQALWCGMPIGKPYECKNVGKPAKTSVDWYLYSIARDIAENPDTPWELFPEYEVRGEEREWDELGKKWHDKPTYMSYDIYKKVEG